LRRSAECRALRGRRDLRRADRRGSARTACEQRRYLWNCTDLALSFIALPTYDDDA
jgi:hypothetical protein